MKNVLFFHDEFPCGGAERVTIDVANYLSEFGYDFFVLACKKKDDVANIKIIELPEKDWNSMTNAKFFVNVINSYSIDIFVLPIHILKHLDYIMELAPKCKLVFALHSLPLWETKVKIAAKQKRARASFLKKMELYFISYPKAKWFKAYDKQFIELHRKAYDKSAAYVVLCEEYKDELISRLKVSTQDNKFRVIPNSERTSEKIYKEKKKQILFVGRFSYVDKRVDRLIDIWKMIYKKLPDWELILVGGGEEEGNLRKRVLQNKLERISFAGFQKHVEHYYEEASVICLTSTFEGWPLCLTEAQVNGVIPVAFDSCAGIHHIVAPSGVNGILVQPFNKRAFANALLRLLNSPEQLDAIRKNVVVKAEEYSPRVIGKKWMDLFESL